VAKTKHTKGNTKAKAQANDDKGKTSDDVDDSEEEAVAKKTQQNKTGQKKRNTGKTKGKAHANDDKGKSQTKADDTVDTPMTTNNDKDGTGGKYPPGGVLTVDVNDSEEEAILK
jgi:hypothetical protein